MRELKFHEKKLLKKVDFLQWKGDSTLREAQVMRRYHLQRRDDYLMYNKLCGQIRKLANRISLLDPRDPFRAERADALLEKIYQMGLITSAKKGLSEADKVTVSAFCRLKMAETVKQAVTLVEQGHVRVGPETVTDPAYLVTRTMEDFVTWVDTSKIKRKVATYNDQLDDYELM
ncbi:Small subunit (SSU) processome component [Gonapodya sp. JEL0774]|nr:Small subunit (SSU) processome component [Gonapodya sp. JEL0774]